MPLNGWQILLAKDLAVLRCLDTPGLAFAARCGPCGWLDGAGRWPSLLRSSACNSATMEVHFGTHLAARAHPSHRDRGSWNGRRAIGMVDFARARCLRGISLFVWERVGRENEAGEHMSNPAADPLRPHFALFAGSLTSVGY